MLYERYLRDFAFCEHMVGRPKIEFLTPCELAAYLPKRAKILHTTLAGANCEPHFARTDPRQFT